MSVLSQRSSGDQRTIGLLVVADDVPGDSHGRGRAPSADEHSVANASRAGAESAFDVSADDSPNRCPYCDRPFRRARSETLHRGLEHSERLSDRERAAFDRAVREEDGEIRRFRLYALGVLVLLYFGLLILAAFVV
ncbi:hypothetical protein [Natrinema sp. 1APR25-10V2]|uniref:DUF7410 domain-containing protein n=1 Tax=Natrinema sp. 1APR25-10V2 TaxID=2951081 RepID=UPI0028750175|nr:hypothetical protein [Natrinema sp. 1APR25-10V2]MDS0477832.1 hypothetical protein [Natrinema sp. 1APR25-10V2]